MAKKVLYLGNGKWCWTDACKVHAATIAHKNAYIAASASGDERQVAAAVSRLVSTPEGVNTYRYLKTAELEQKLGRKPTIGLDLDGTTGDFTHGLRTYMGTKLNVSREQWLSQFPDPADYGMWKGETAWYKDRADFLNHFQQAEREGMYKEIPVFDYASETIQDLKHYGFNIKVITARNMEFNDDTRAWINSHSIPVRKILNHGMEKEKAKNIDVYIDDAPEVISRLIEHKKKVVIMDQLYNKHVNPSPTDSKRVDAWGAELVNAIFDLMDERKTK